MNLEKEQALQTLKTCRGQVDGIIKMLEDSRYCIDISNQIMASQALLKKANKLILSQHLKNCVLSASDDKNLLSQKTDEIIQVLDKLLK